MFRCTSSLTDNANSVWDTHDADAAVTAARSLYGKNASLAAAWCALAARGDGRTADYRFWFDIFERIRNEDIAARDLAMH